MTLASRTDLYARGVATLLASWDAYADGSSGATVRRLDGVAVAVFPTAPERAVYNNALLDRGLGPTERAAAIEAMRNAYRAAGVDGYAAWVHESDDAMQGEFGREGYRLAETTQAMGMPLDRIAPTAPDAHIEPTTWDEYVRCLHKAGAPPGLLGGADPSAFHVLIARLDDEIVGTAMAFDHEGDSGVFNVSTLDPHRRQGIGTALLLRLLNDAIARGNQTATLQSTEMARGVYAAVGFRELGRILEYAPATR